MSSAPQPSTLDQINALEEALKAAWMRGDRAVATELTLTLAGLWQRRRNEQAEEHRPQRRHGVWSWEASRMPTGRARR